MSGGTGDLLSGWLDNTLAQAGPDGENEEAKINSSPTNAGPQATGNEDDLSNWFQNQMNQDEDDSGEDDEDEMEKWMKASMVSIKEETPGEIPPGAPHVSDELWKEYDVELKVSAIPPISRSGWLQKRGRTNNSYKRRFCELRGHKLYYYHSENQKAEGQGEDKRGEINLLHADIHAQREEKGDRMVRKKDFLHYVDAQAARDRGVWIDSEDIRRCMNHTCQRKFNVAWRRHHCRYCGRIFCNDCITTGRGRKLINQPRKVEKQGYEGVKICRQCAVFPETRMTHQLNLIFSGRQSDNQKRNTMPKTSPTISSALSIKKNSIPDSDDIAKYNSAPIERTNDRPAQLPAAFLQELERPGSVEGIDDLLDSPSGTDMEASPAQLPDEWMKGLSMQNLPPQEASDEENVKGKPSQEESLTQSKPTKPLEKAKSFDHKDMDNLPSLPNDYAQRRADSIKRRKNRGNRMTFTQMDKQLQDKLKDDKDRDKEKARKEREKKKKEAEKNPSEDEDEGNALVESLRGASKEEEVKSEDAPLSEWDTVVFCIQPQGMGRKYTFQAESPAACKDWVLILKMHTNPMNKSILKKKEKGKETDDVVALLHSRGKSWRKRRDDESKKEEKEKVGKVEKKLRFNPKKQYYQASNVQRPIQDKNFVRTGYLAKVGMQIRTWKVRFFALRGNMLTYFRISGELKQQRGTIWLKGAEVNKIDSAPVRHREDLDLNGDGDDATPTSSAINSAKLTSLHNRNLTKHINFMLPSQRSEDDAGAESKRRRRIHARNVSSDSLEPNVRKEKTRYVYEFVIRTRQQPKTKSGDDIHVSKLKKGRTYHVRAASRRDRREWIKAITFAAGQ